MACVEHEPARFNGQEEIYSFRKARRIPNGRVVVLGRSAPRAARGLREGDIVVEFNSQSVARIGDLHKELNDERASLKATLRVIRRNEELALEITPEESRRRCALTQRVTTAIECAPWIPVNG